MLVSERGSLHYSIPAAHSSAMAREIHFALVAPSRVWNLRDPIKWYSTEALGMWRMELVYEGIAVEAMQL
jgi:hypothetical protein